MTTTATTTTKLSAGKAYSRSMADATKSRGKGRRDPRASGRPTGEENERRSPRGPEGELRREREPKWRVDNKREETDAIRSKEHACNGH